MKLIVQERYFFTARNIDPRRERDFWTKWRFFEVQHGNEDTFRDMLRVRRSIDAQYAQVHFNAELVAQKEVRGKKVELDPMAQAERIIKEKEEENESENNNNKGKEKNLDKDEDGFRKVVDRDTLLKRLGTTTEEENCNFEPCGSFQGQRIGYVFKLGVQGLGYYEDNNNYSSKKITSSSSSSSSTATLKKTKAKKIVNPEEIDIGLDLDDLEEMEVPLAVMGGLAETAANLPPVEIPQEKEEEPEPASSSTQNKEDAKKQGKKRGNLGALARFKKPKR